MSVQIRVLGPGDAGEVRELRLRALREHPEAFATSEREEAERSPEDGARRLVAGPEQAMLGAFADGRLVGLAALTRPPKPKLRHRARIDAMYVAPEARGRGVGRDLLERALAHAAAWGVSDVALAVTVGNRAARDLYAARGFTSYGTEPRALWVDGRYHDVELMNLRLRAAPGESDSGSGPANGR